jgi:TonB family protein
MNQSIFAKSGMRLTAVRAFQAAALALVVTLAMPAGAADERSVKSRVAPIYPDIAKRMKIEGVVNIQATVEPNGKVSDAKSVGGNLILAPAAEDAVRKWVFEAAPASSKVKVDVNFVLAH